MITLTLSKSLKQSATAIEIYPLAKCPDLGKNSLDTTEKWEAREEEIQTLISTYIKALNKNVKDTKSNVDLLKEQDESIIHSQQQRGMTVGKVYDAKALFDVAKDREKAYDELLQPAG